MTSNQDNLIFTWRCPSNIAFVKYWGKKSNQIPCNASLSMTLSSAYTEVRLELIKKVSISSDIELTYRFEGKENEKFEQRIIQYLDGLRNQFSLLNEYQIVFDSTNSFPHSAGIASSASAFGAIALALLDAEYQLTGKEIDNYFFEEASNLARLGSGSASRSIFGHYAAWGEAKEIEHSSNLYAIPVEKVHENFQNMRDAILIVDDQPKSVSSSVGHALMNEHPYAQQRFVQANERVGELIDILHSGDYDAFIRLVESEALTLHSMMMTSNDYYLLMKPNTLKVIEGIWEFRKQTNIPVCFTLDAGPNIHVIYPDYHHEAVRSFLEESFQNSIIDIIFDKIGKGPEKRENR